MTRLEELDILINYLINNLQTLYLHPDGSSIKKYENQLNTLKEYHVEKFKLTYPHVDLPDHLT